MQNQSAASNNQFQDPDLSQRFQGPTQWLHLHCVLLWLSCDLWWWFIVNCDDDLLWLVMIVYCELWWWFIIPMTYNYACDDVLLWIVMVFCELRGVCYTGQISKKGVLVVLPSAKRGVTECQAKTLGEETNFCYSGNFFCRVFCLCQVYSNGHSTKWP